MMLRLVLLAFALLLGKGEGNPILAGYFANWAQYHTSPYTYLPSKLAPIAGTLDQLMYAFAYIDPNSFQVVTVEPKDPEFYAQIVAYKKENPNLKVLLSVGGWNMPSATFSKMAADPSHRSTFVSSCMTMMKTHGFDGIDLDWESPCSPERHDYVKYTCANVKDSVDPGGNCPADTQNYLQLVKDMRTAFGSDYRITVASQASQMRWQHFDLIGMDQYVDFWHVMTYDYTVSDILNSNTTAPNSPLYTPPEQNVAQWSVNYTVEGYLALGVPASKIMIGTPLYGHTWYVPGLSGSSWQKFGLPATVQGLCCGPFKTTYGAKYGKGSQLCGTMMYSEIQAAGGPEYYDNETQSAIRYLATDSSDGWTKAGTWITYNNVQSAEAIAQYAVDKKLAGVFLFDTSMDSIDFTSGEFTYDVTHAVHDTLNGGGPGPTPGQNDTCSPVSQCNVCAACCKSYLKTHSDCVACVQQECPKVNICLPSKGCNVCAACCKSYLTTQADCDGCVAQSCKSP